MTTQNFIDMYGLLLGENAGPVKKMMMVHAAYYLCKYVDSNMTMTQFLSSSQFCYEEIQQAIKIILKESEKKLLDLE
jgi:hypothetical protein